MMLLLLLLMLVMLLLRVGVHLKTDEVGVGPFGRSEEGMDLHSIVALLDKARGFLGPYSFADSGAIAFTYWQSSSPSEGFTELGSIVIYARLLLGLLTAAGLVIGIAHSVIEHAESRRRPEPGLRDRALASSDHSQLSGHLHEFDLAPRVAPARLRKQFGSRFAISPTRRAPY